MTRDDYKNNITDTTGILGRFKNNYDNIHTIEDPTFNIGFDSDILIGGDKQYFDAKSIRANINISTLKSTLGDDEAEWTSFIDSIYDFNNHKFIGDLTYIKIILCIMYIVIFSEKLSK